MSSESLQPVISGLVGGLIAAAIASLASRSTPATVNGETTLRYPQFLLILYVPLTAVFAGFTVFNALGGNRVNSYVVAVSVPLLVTAVGTYLAVEVAVVTVVVKRDALRCISPWRGRRDVPWEDIVGASHSSMFGWYALQTKNHGVVRISTMVKGSALLPEILKEHRVLLS